MSKHKFLEIRIPIEEDNPSIQRIEELCIKCGQCRRVCENDIAVGKLYSLDKTNDIPICINCGQCANVCPTNSITEIYDYLKVKKHIFDNDKIVIVSTSPSVRVSIGEEFGIEPGEFLEKKLVAALRKLGFNFVLDTNFAADLTIMEEASELINRVVKNENLPQFTSCCPAWVKFIETFYPDMRNHISSAKSPIGMQGPTIKTYFAKENNLDPKKIINVALTPCTAKKFEINRDEMNDSAKYNNIEDLRDMDYVVTVRELAKWLKEEGIDFNSLEESEYDKLMGEASGAGIIFGNTGGVMEAATRTAYKFLTGENPTDNKLEFTPVRGMDGIREAEVSIGDKTLKLAIAHGTANAKILLDKLRDKSIYYDFIEVMTCRGGCIGGGGQPKHMPMTDEIRLKRIEGLYKKDREVKIRCSHDNPDIKKVYEDFYGEPLSELAEKMLHTSYIDRSKDLGE